MDGHQVVGFAPRLRELLLQKLVKRFQIIQPPVLPGTNLAQIAAQVDKMTIPFLVGAVLPGQDLIDPGEDQSRSAPVELGWHEGSAVSRQGGQANQGRWLQEDGRAWYRSVAGYRGKGPVGRNSRSRLAESEYRYAG